MVMQIKRVSIAIIFQLGKQLLHVLSIKTLLQKLGVSIKCRKSIEQGNAGTTKLLCWQAKQQLPANKDDDIVREVRILLKPKVLQLPSRSISILFVLALTFVALKQ